MLVRKRYRSEECLPFAATDNECLGNREERPSLERRQRATRSSFPDSHEHLLAERKQFAW